MPNNMKDGSIDLNQVLTVNVKTEGDKETLAAIQRIDNAVQNLGKSLESMARGNDLSRYWKTNESSIEGVIAAYERFRRVQNETNAGDLVKSLNSFIAQGGEANTLIERYGESARDLVRTAGQLAPAIREAFSISTLKDAFQAFEEMEAHGVELREVFAKLNAGDVTQLQQALDAVNQSLAMTQKKLVEAQKEIRILSDSSGVDVLRDRIGELEARLEDLTVRATKDFQNFLKANNFSFDDLEDYGRFYDYFEKIKDGTYTASEAIGLFKNEYSYLLAEMNKGEGAFNSQQVEEFISKLTEACQSIELMRQDIVSLANTGTLSEMSRTLSQNTELTEAQRAAMANMADQGGSLQSVVQILAELIRASGEANESVGSTYASLQQLLQTTSALGSIDVEKLETIRGILMSFVKLDGIEVDGAALKNIIDAVDAFSKIQNSGALNIISNVDLHGFDDLHISKASLKNLAENLPIIARADVQAIRDLANIDFSKLNELHVTKGNVEHFRELADAVAKVRESLNITDANTGNLTTATLGVNSVEQVDNLRASIAELYNEADTYVETLRGSIDVAISSVGHKILSAIDFVKPTEDVVKLRHEINELSAGIENVTRNYESMNRVRLSAAQKAAAEAELSILGSEKKASKKSYEEMLNGTYDPSIVAELTQRYQQWLMAVADVEGKLKTLGAQGSEVISTLTGTGEALRNDISLLERFATESAAAEAAQRSMAEAAQRSIVEVSHAQVEAELSILNSEKKAAKKSYEGMLNGAYDPAIVAELTQRYQQWVLAIADVEGKLKTVGAQGGEVISSLTATGEAIRNDISLLDQLTNESTAAEAAQRSMAEATRAQRDKLATQELKQYTKDLASLRKELDVIQASLVKLMDSGVSSGELTKALSEYDRVDGLLKDKERRAVTGETGSVDYLRKQVVALSGATRGMQELAAAEAKAASEGQEAATKIRNLTGELSRIETASGKGLDSLSNSKYDADAVEALRLRRQKLVETISEYRTGQKQATAEVIESLRAEANAINDEVNALRRKVSEAEAAEAATRRSSNEAAAAARKETAEMKQTASLRQQVSSYIINNTKAYKMYGDQLDAIMKELSKEGGVSSERAAQLSVQFKNIKHAVDAAGASGKTFFEMLKDGWRRFGGWSIVTRSMMLVVRGFKQMVTSVKEVDAAMTELKKITDLTDAGYQKFYKDAVKTAQGLGATVSDTINAAADFARLGFDIDVSLDLANAALVYKNVGYGINDISQATESLTSTIKAFGDETYDAMQIVDMFNEVGNHFAISSKGIGDALMRSASALAGAGNTLEESIGLITAANAVIQNPESVGTALKTISMYLRAAKTELEEAGEDAEGCANSVSELREEMKALTGVDIMLNENTFKSTTQILRELSKVWDSLTDVTRANLTELMGGKRGANVIQALIKNFQDAEDAIATASDSAGSALAENEKYLESIAGKIDLLKGKAETFANNVLSSGLVKFVVDIGNGLLSTLNSLHEINALLPLIAAGAATITFTGMAKDIAAASAKIVALATAPGGITMEKFAEGASLELGRLTAVEKALTIAQIERSLAGQTGNAALNAEQIAAVKAALAQEAHASANISVTASLQSMFALMPLWSKIALGVAAVLGAATVVMGAHNKSIAEGIERANNAKDTYDEIEKTYSHNVDTLDKLESRFSALSKGVDENGKNVSLTANEYEEYKSIVQQIVDISPDIVSGYDLERNAILNYKDAIDEARESQDKLYKSQKEDYFSEMGDRFSSWQHEIDNLRTDARFIYMGDDISGSNKMELLDILESFGLNVTSQRSNVTATNEPYFDTEQLREIVSLKDEIQTLMHQSDLFEETDVNRVMQWIGKVQKVFNEESAVYDKAENDLRQWVEFQDWFISETDDRMTNAFLGQLDTLFGDLDEKLDAAEKQAKAAEVFQQIQSIFQDPDFGVSELEKMAGAVSEGEKTIDELEGELQKFKWIADDYDPVALEIIEQYIIGIANTAHQTADEAGAASQVIQASVQGFSKAIDQLRNGYSLLEKAQNEIDTDGSLHADTIKSISDALNEGEKLTDYLYEENGAIKLNIDAWKNRARAIAESDIAAMEQEIQLLNGKVTASRYDGTISIKSVEEAKTRIAELEATIAIYKATLEQPVENDDPLDLSGMFSNIGSVESKVSPLVKALEDIKKGNLQNWNELVGKNPELMKLPGPFNTLEEQEQAIRKVLSEYDAEVDEYINTQIKALEAARSIAEEAGESTDVIDILIANLNKLKLATLSDTVDADSQDPFKGLTNTLDNAAKYADIVHDALDGVDFDLLQRLMETFGEDWEKYILKDPNGNIIGVDAEQIKAVVEAELEAYGASEQLKEAFSAMWNEALKGEKVQTQFEKMSDAINKANKAMDIVKTLQEDGFNSNVLEGLRDFFGDGEDTDYHYFTELAQNDFKAFKKELRAYIDNLYKAAGATSTETKVMHKAWKDATSSTITDIKGVTEALNAYQDGVELLGSIRVGNMDQMELIEKMLKLSETSGIGIDQLLHVDGKTIKASTTALRQYVDGLLSWKKLKNVPGMTEEIAAGIRKSAKAAIEAEQATDAWSTALSSLDKATSAIDSIESGDDIFKIIPAIQDIAKETGKSVDDFFNIVNKKVYWDESAISEWAVSYIDNLQKMREISPSTAKYLKELAAAQIEESVAMGKLNNAVNKYQDANGAITSISIDGKITYDQFQSLINVSKEYANAIEYNNGVITISKKKFDKITKSILDTQKAEAVAKRDAILLGDEYKRLVQLEKEHNLSNTGKEKLKQLEVEAASWNVIATEIENANMAYQKFLHADDDPSGEQYTAAEKAKKVINDTLYNNESEIFGKKGRAQYKYAVEFLIEPKAKLGTREFDRSWKKVQRYMEENGQGLQNFIDDLIRKGLVSQVDGSKVELDTTLEEMARKLHISEDLVRSLIEEWNTYGAGIDVGPTVDEEVQEETKSKLEETKESVDSLIKKADELQGKEIDLDTDPALGKLDTVESRFQDVYLDIDMIGDHDVNVNTNPAIKAVNALDRNLGAVLKTLKNIIANGVIDVDVRETYTRTVIDEGMSAAGGYAPLFRRGKSAANGTKGAPGGKTLVGEQGREIVVDPETNTWYTVGDNGAEFANIPSGALVFNAAQTQALLRSGHIYTRAGNSMLSGNAAANVKGTDAVGSTNDKQKYIYVVRKRSDGKYVAIKGSYNWCQDWMNSHNAYKVEDFTYSSFDSAKEYAYWSNVNLQEQQAAAKKANAQKTSSNSSKSTSVSKTPTTTKKSTKVSGSNRRNIPIRVSSSSGGGSSGSSGGDYSWDGDNYVDDYVDPIDELTESYKALNEELDHLIEHQLYLYDVADRALDYNGMEKSLEEQAKIYKQQMQRAQEGIDELISKGVQDSDERLQQVEEMYWTAHRNLYDVYDKINALYVDSLNNQIDGLQSAADHLDTVAESLSKNEVIDVDMFQALLDNGIQYLDYIEKVGDQYVVNQDAVEKMLQAEKEQLAVQSALSYLQRIYEAATDGSINKIRELANATQNIAHDSWHSVRQMLVNIESTAQVPADLMATIYENIEKLMDISGSVVRNTKEAEEKTAAILEHLEDQGDALDKLVDLTEDMIKSEVNDHIKAIQKEVELFREIVDLKKESLAATREEDSYQRDVNDKLKDITDLQNRIDKLALDDSRTAQAERMSLMEELAEKQRDLSDYQSEHSYEAQVEALDKMAEEYEEKRQIEIDALEDSISSEEKVFRLAVDRIENRWDTLYQDLIDWNVATGSVLNSEIVDNWNLAYEAAQKYGDYVNALRGINQELLNNDRENETLNYRVEDIFGQQTKSTGTSDNSDSITNAVKQGVADGLEKSVDEYGTVLIGSDKLNIYSGTDSVSKNTVTPTSSSSNTKKKKSSSKLPEKGYYVLNDGSVYHSLSDFTKAAMKKYPVYHGGGVVDDRGSINSKEAMAILQKGEMVLDRDEQKSLFRLIDLKNYLSEKLGNAIGDLTSIPKNLASQLTSAMQGTPVLAGVGNTQSIDFRPEINVNIQHGGSLSEDDARRYGNMAADTALDRLYSTFERKGISNIFSGKLKS